MAMQIKLTVVVVVVVDWLYFLWNGIKASIIHQIFSLARDWSKPVT